MIIINPGTGSVDGATEENAVTNIKHFVTDLNAPNPLYIQRFPEHDYGEGRYCFLLLDFETYKFGEVQMPGLPLHEVRYDGCKNQNILDFPRLYISDSSWIWTVAKGIVYNDLFEDG